MRAQQTELAVIHFPFCLSTGQQQQQVLQLAHMMMVLSCCCCFHMCLSCQGDVLHGAGAALCRQAIAVHAITSSDMLP